MQKSNIHYWLALKSVPRLAIHKKLALVNHHGLSTLFTSSKLTSANNLTVKQLSAFHQPDWQAIDEIIINSQRCHSEIIGFDDEQYPPMLKQIYDPPLVLFVQGNKSLLHQNQLAIVGSRSASINGRETAFKIAQQLVDVGLVITSGLALGIDAAAHKGALTRHASTIAVVATGLDQVYPRRHRSLAKNIIEKEGAIISEFLPGTSPKAGHFPKRNRIISGLSGVLVVEAALQSGSLITARCALEQNRDVFAIPSGIGNLQAKGCHWLIKQGAKLVEEPADIINELVFLDNSSLHLSQHPKLESSVNEEIDGERLNKDLCDDEMLDSVGFEITPVDTVVLRSKLPIQEVLTRLTILELKGLVAAVPGGYLRL
ncbi:DNA-processing protein DprA [Colwellia sp. MSW7]|uniref:DNA-processing protein DprA n=1 Tax=Colwellia maritima TaxID=2912588 RepID=A0ABS9WWR0_9GAMM|nr:DNA-processing protein DprA [Colwellia maritima]